MKPRYKNLILISIDNLRSDCVGANKNKGLLLNNYSLKIKPKTPTINRFAKNGVFFDQCFSAAPYTTASHASILTGQWPFRHRVRRFYKEKLKSPTIISLLKKEGFKTLFQTDWPFLLGPELNFTPDVDNFVVRNEAESLEWLKEKRKNRLACFFHFTDVHYPYGVNVNSLDDPREIGDFLPAEFLKEYKKNKQSGAEKFLFLRRNFEKMLFDMHKKGFYNEIMSLYVRGVNVFDQGRFKNFVSVLEAEGFLNDSLVVIFGDHGEKWGEGQRAHNDMKYYIDSLCDEVLRVPLIFFGKDLKQEFFSQAVRTIDVVPTIFYLMHINKNQSDFDGRVLDFKHESKDREAHAFLYRPDRKVLKNLRSFVNQEDLEKMLDNRKRGFYCQSTLRDSGKKIIRFYDESGKTIEERIYQVGKNFERVISSKKNDVEIIRKRLNEYDCKYLNREGSSEKKVTAELKMQLRNLGYKI